VRCPQQAHKQASLQAQGDKAYLDEVGVEGTAGGVCNALQQAHEVCTVQRAARIAARGIERGSVSAHRHTQAFILISVLGVFSLRSLHCAVAVLQSHCHRMVGEPSHSLAHRIKPQCVQRIEHTTRTANK
jgi:hypothetical protein